MAKRSASSSPIEGNASKKQKVAQDTATPVPTTPETSAIHSMDPDAMTVDQPKPAEPTNPIEPTEDAGDNESIAPPVQPTNHTTAGTPADKPKPPPVATLFTPWKPTITVPPSNPFWGLKPRTGDPRPHAVQLPARTSNAATNPPLWEDRGYRFKRGSRHVSYFGLLSPPSAPTEPTLDQEDLLVLKLIDMRPKSKKDRTPRRTPTFYAFDAGKPNDWNNMQAIKALNDRRGQAIDRITVDAPWQPVEREYLAALLRENPDASVWELAERHNDRFMGVDYVCATGFGFEGLSEGRTVESVRHEYVSYKAAYDGGEVPKGVRWRNDRSVRGKKVRGVGRMESVFGVTDKKLEKEWDEGVEGEDGGEEKKGVGKSKKVADVTPEDEAARQTAAATAMIAQPELTDDDEDLLVLAGIHHPDEIRTSPTNNLPVNSPHRTSSITSSVLSEAPADLESPGALDYQTLLTTIETETVAAVVAQGSVPEEAFAQGTVTEEAVVEETVTEDTAIKQTIVEDLTINDSPPVTPKTTPAARPARVIHIDDDYDDDEEL